MAKLVVVATWCVAMSTWVIALGFGIGLALGLPGWSSDQALRSIGTIALSAVLTTALQTTTAFFASVGRGYLPPLAWALLTILVSQVMAVLGWGAWFPWAVPALVAGAAGPDGEVATSASLVLVALAAVLGLAGTLLWWRRADQSG